jgi:uncharacterized membrane protein YfcA
MANRDWHEYWRTGLIRALGAGVGAGLGEVMTLLLESAQFAQALQQRGLPFAQPLNWHIGPVDMLNEITVLVGAWVGFYLTYRLVRRRPSNRS